MHKITLLKKKNENKRKRLEDKVFMSLLSVIKTFSYNKIIQILQLEEKLKIKKEVIQVYPCNRQSHQRIFCLKAKNAIIKCK